MAEPTATRTRVCAVDDIEPGAAHRFDIGRHRVAVVRIGDDFYALGDVCTHDDYSLSEGEIDADEHTIECWKHGSLFDLETGEALTLPATRPAPVYDVVVENGDVYVVIA
jgi:3-phenylpropionate/trans-cinnamate dioxygenase ferredoxin subunit